MILDQSRNKEQQDLQLSTNLTRVFVLYITLPKVQNEDPVKIVLKSLEKGSNMILDQSRNKEQQDLQLSTNLTRVFVLYITLPKVQNEDSFKTISHVTRMYPYVTRMLLVCILMYPYVPCVMTFYKNNPLIPIYSLKEMLSLILQESSFQFIGKDYL